MKKVLVSVALLFLLAGFMCGVLSVFYAWAVWCMAGCFTACAVLCVVVNER